jgi:hypothetical protein
MTHGPAWSRPSPCLGRLPLQSVLLPPTPATGHPACAPTLVLLDSSVRVLRRTPTTPLRSTTPTSPMEGASTCTTRRPPCLWRHHRLLRLRHRL